MPVLKNAGDLNIAGLARGIADIAARTRDNKITPDELSGTVGADAFELGAVVSDHARDERDSSRAAAPLKAADDAILLDTGDLTIGGAVQAAISAVEARLRQG